MVSYRKKKHVAPVEAAGEKMLRTMLIPKGKKYQRNREICRQ
jgi:hypothetical protein